MIVQRKDWCSRCDGRGATPHRIVDCALDIHCTEHYQHYEWRRCWRCRGTRRADIFTLLYRRIIEWLTSS